MNVLVYFGVALMGIAAIALVSLAIDMAFRLGGEGILMALGLAAGATVPAWIALRMAGVSSGMLAKVATGWVSLLLSMLAVFGIVLLSRRQREGFMVVAIAVVLGAATYVIAPGVIVWLSALPVGAKPS